MKQQCRSSKDEGRGNQKNKTELSSQHHSTLLLALPPDSWNAVIFTTITFLRVMYSCWMRVGKCELWQQRCECSRPARQWIFGVLEEHWLISSPKIIPKKSSYTSSNHNSNNTWKLGGILDHAWPFKDNDAMLGFQPWQCILHLLFIALSQGASFPYKTSTTIYSRRLLYLLR